MEDKGRSKKFPGSLDEFDSLSPDLSRIPRPASTRLSTTRRREPPTMIEAYQFAAEKHLAAQGSPSPAPRPRDNSVGSDRRPLRNLFPQRPIDLGRLGAKPAARSQEGNIGSQANTELQPRKIREITDEEDEAKNREFNQRDDIFEAIQERERNGLFSQRKLYSKSTHPTAPPSRRSGSAFAARNGTDGNGDAPRGWGSSAPVDRNWLARFAENPDLATVFNQNVGTLGSSKRNFSRQNDDRPGDRNPSPVFPRRPATMGPPTDKKGFSGWQVDEEFTGGDLQVSTSPPVTWQRTNTRFDDIRQWEIDAERRSPYHKHQFLDRLNTRVDEIAREVSSWNTQPLDKFVGAPCELETSTIRPPHITDGQRCVSAPIQATTTNHESKHARGTDMPKTEEISPTVQTEQLISTMPRSQSANNVNEHEGEMIPNTPVTIYSRPPLGLLDNDKEKIEVANGAAISAPAVRQDSRDLLQKLARASSKSPSPRAPQQKDDTIPQQAEDLKAADDKAISDDKVNGDRAEPNKPTKDTGSSSKLTGGIPSLSRTSSATSVSSKHSVASHDPTARIMAEAKLFAPGDNSERGSNNASSSPMPESDSENGNNDMDDTPRPNKPNPLTMPTPKITGAFVDTPAPLGDGRRDPVSSSKHLSPEKTFVKARDLSSSPRATKSEGDQRPGRQRSGKDTRRTKSSSRPRAPLKNSAKPPTVKEDLRQICLKNDIDDSELDDLTDLIMSSADPEKFLQILKNDETEAGEPKNEESLDDQDAQLKRLNGMSDALKTGLAGIRTAKKGIERLEDQVSRPGKKTKQPLPTARNNTGIPTTSAGETYTYIQIPVPRLYRTEPRFKLTIFGLILLLLGIWQAYWFAEDVFYDKWGKQTLCYRGSPCRWDVDAPEYGYVIPVKFDEWLTGSALRPHAAHWLEEAEDGWADLVDWWTGTDIRDVHHQSIRDYREKRQYWRRIEKKGLYPEWNPAPWMLPQIEAWEREAQAREAAEARAAMGYDDHDEVDNDTESMSEDQPVSFDNTDGSSGSWW